MTDALFNAQTTIYNALAASSAVTALLGTPARIYDHVPPGAVFPYMAFGAIAVHPYDAKTETGFEQIITLDIWSRYRGSKEAKDIMQAVYDTLHRAALSVTGEVFLLSEFHSADLVLESDGFTYRAALRFTVITQST